MATLQKTVSSSLSTSVPFRTIPSYHYFQLAAADGGLLTFTYPGFRCAAPGVTISVAAMRLVWQRIDMVVEELRIGFICHFQSFQTFRLKPELPLL
jgi:uncharacterized membrane protein